MKTALQQYIEDIKNGTCEGEDYYLELEKQNVIEAFKRGQCTVITEAEQYYNETFNNQ